MSKRIISVVPSLTEFLIDLGISAQVIGRTRFCIHPPEDVQHIDIIGGTKNPRIDKIRDMKPDLVIANKEENRKEDVEAIQEFCEVLVTEISTIEDALFAMHHIAKCLNAEKNGAKLIEKILSILPEPTHFSEINTAYFIWKEPWMSVGGDTYIHDVMQTFGLRNVFQYLDRYPAITFDQLKSANPELILLSSEPYPFKEKHIAELKEILPNSSIHLVDGEWFSWYGSRMLPSFKALSEWRNQLTVCN